MILLGLIRAHWEMAGVRVYLFQSARRTGSVWPGPSQAALPVNADWSIYVSPQECSVGGIKSPFSLGPTRARLAPDSRPLLFARQARITRAWMGLLAP